MAFSYIKRTGVRWDEFLETLRGDLDAIDGWQVYDDRIITAGELVMEMQTSEGIGNELYVRIAYDQGYSFGNSDEVDFEIGTGWDDTAHDYTGDWIRYARAHFGHSQSDGSQPTTYHLCGDSDHFVLCAQDEGNGTSFDPVYVGLMDKYEAGDTQLQSAVVLCRYLSSTSIYWDTNNRLPILKGYSGGFNAYGRLMKETLFNRSRDHENFLNWGPWGDDQYIYTSMASVWEDNWGMRGYLKNVRYVSDAYNASMSNGDTVVINGDEWYFWNASETSTTIAQYSPWSFYHNSTGAHHHGVFIRKTQS